MANTVKIKCKGSGLVDISKLKIIQGDLKELSKDNYQKLRARIEKVGFDAPIFVWKDNVLDGTQRLRVILKMVEEGWELPENKVPVCEIQAKTLQEAKDRILGYISQFGKVSDQGLYEFIQDMPDLDFDLLDLPNFDMDTFKAGFLGDVQTGDLPNLPDGDKSPFQQMTFTLHDSQAEIVNEAIKAAKQAGPFVDSENENSNGNALARIAEAYRG